MTATGAAAKLDKDPSRTGSQVESGRPRLLSGHRAEAGIENDGEIADSWADPVGSCLDAEGAQRDKKMNEARRPLSGHAVRIESVGRTVLRAGHSEKARNQAFAQMRVAGKASTPATTITTRSSGRPSDPNIFVSLSRSPPDGVAPWRDDVKDPDRASVAVIERAAGDGGGGGGGEGDGGALFGASDGAGEGYLPATFDGTDKSVCATFFRGIG
jgi:hypothetical protein